METCQWNMVAKVRVCLTMRHTRKMGKTMTMMTNYGMEWGTVLYPILAILRQNYIKLINYSCGKPVTRHTLLIYHHTSIKPTLIEGSLEVKLLTIWTDEEQRWEE